MMIFSTKAAGETNPEFHRNQFVAAPSPPRPLFTQSTHI
jgi:hypothetical protein